MNFYILNNKPKEKMMKKLIIMLTLGMFSGLMAQGSFVGSVTDADGNALPGANLAVEGTSLGAAHRTTSRAAEGRAHG